MGTFDDRGCAGGKRVCYIAVCWCVGQCPGVLSSAFVVGGCGAAVMSLVGHLMETMGNDKLEGMAFL